MAVLERDLILPPTIVAPIPPEVMTPEVKPSTEDAFVLLTPAESVRDVLDHLSTAEERAYFLTMAWSPGSEVVNRFTRTLSERKKANPYLDAVWASDRYSDLIHNEKPWPDLLSRGSYKAWKKKLDRETDYLQQNYVDVRWLNHPRVTEMIVPFRGRNHAKMIVIDNKAWIVGPNTTDTGFQKNHDWVVGVNDLEVVHPMSQVFNAIIHGNIRDYEQDIVIPAGNSTVLVDRGVPGSSVILDAAVTAIDEAKKSVYGSSQFTPEGPVLDALFRAKDRGVFTDFLTNHPDNLGLPYRGMEIYNRLKKRIRGINRSEEGVIRREKGTLVHGKGLLVDEEWALFTSHNLNKQGVKAGTTEFALLTQV